MRWEAQVWDVRPTERKLTSAWSEDSLDEAVNHAKWYIGWYEKQGWTAELGEPGVVRLSKLGCSVEVVVEQKEA